MYTRQLCIHQDYDQGSQVATQRTVPQHYPLSQSTIIIISIVKMKDGCNNVSVSFFFWTGFRLEQFNAAAILL